MVDAESVAAEIKRFAPGGAALLLDSRKVRKGDVFFAVKGVHTDGRVFIEKACLSGASCVVAEKGYECACSVPLIEIENLYPALGPIASAYYGNPTSQMTGIAVTGTNGKTTSANWIADLMNRLGTPCACIGTLGCTLNGKALPSVSMTTPDPLTLQATFAELLNCGCKAFAMEASSIGLEQGRLDGTEIRTAVFTNLTRDHLDYHGTMENYLQAKEILFRWPSVAAAVINQSGEPGLEVQKTAEEAGKEILTVSARNDQSADLSAVNIRHTREGLEFEVCFKGHSFPVAAHFLGLFNVENFLCAVGALVSIGFDIETVLREAVKLMPPAGRMQIVREDFGPIFAIDYSHTPDAITQAIKALEGLAKVRGGRIWIVVGAGGDRDHGKRPLMGQAACAADEVVLTSDNPRSEDPKEILKQIKAGTTKPCSVIEDRRKAIEYAAEHAASDDVILIAGKGHEDYQEVRGVKHHFSDVEEAREALRKLRNKNE